MGDPDPRGEGPEGPRKRAGPAGRAGVHEMDSTSSRSKRSGVGPASGWSEKTLPREPGGNVAMVEEIDASSSCGSGARVGAWANG
jgi:hypothetical protein